MELTSKDFQSPEDVRWCPGCGDYKVIDTARRSGEDALSPGKFLGAFHQCGGPNGSKCWHMTKYEAKKPNKALYENGRR
jgi:hypothetical protein